MNVDDCLPETLRGPATRVTRIPAGLSGAAVYCVEAGDECYVLKVADEPLADWRRKLDIQRRAADAGVAPRIVHVDDERRAVVTEFVVDRSFPAYFFDPRTRDAAIELLGRTLRRVHDVPLPADAPAVTARELLAALSGALSGFSVPAFAADAMHHMLAEEPPQRDRIVLSHNDVNPSNVVYDGERLLLLDWNTSGPNDALYDLATISVFLRMDDSTCTKLLAAHDGAPVTALPAAFHYYRRLAAITCGAAFLHLARTSGHPGHEHVDAVPTLAEFYQRMRAGEVSIATAEGQWAFGLALLSAT